MYIVMLNGHVACLKTTLSYLLAPALKLGHISTSVLGEFISQADDKNFLILRNQRYARAAVIAETYLKENLSILLDGNYTFRRWREEIYRLAATHGVSDVISITCRCSRPEVIAERIAYRLRVPDAPDANANNMEAYWGSVKDFEPIEVDRFPDGRRFSRIEFDSGTFSVSLVESYSPFALEVANTLQQLITSGSLDRPLFPRILPEATVSPVSSPHRRLWIDLSGIGGSGKTTQCGLLAAQLRSAHPELRVSASGEFSDSPLGDFLRSRLNRHNGFMLDFGESPSSLLSASLTVLADNLKKSEIYMQDSAWDVAILDAYRWSCTAHTLAFLPPDTEDEMKSQVMNASEMLARRFHPLAGKGITIFLDCPPEAAFERLQRRLGAPLKEDYLFFLRSLAASYETILAGAPDVYRIDALKSPERVAQEITSIIQNLL